MLFIVVDDNSCSVVNCATFLIVLVWTFPVCSPGLISLVPNNISRSDMVAKVPPVFQTCTKLAIFLKSRKTSSRLRYLTIDLSWFASSPYRKSIRDHSIDATGQCHAVQRGHDLVGNRDIDHDFPLQVRRPIVSNAFAPFATSVPHQLPTTTCSSLHRPSVHAGCQFLTFN
ncbi:hypothetical protein AcV7_006947 [Taiwanofungus camphoratus]|nr:hypothetical protein AcV7_006947 [Antrodia cinnamomea]